MFIDTEHLRASTPREFGYALLDERLIPAFDRGAADAVSGSQLALAGAAFVSLEYLQAIGLGRAQPGPNPGKPMPEIAIAVGAVILGHTQVQHQQLITLTGVFERAPMGGLDPHPCAGAVDAGQASPGRGPDVDVLSSFDFLDHQTR